MSQFVTLAAPVHGATAAATDAPNLPVKGYLREFQLIPSILPFSSTTLWRKVREGKFPKPLKLSERVTAWRVEDIAAWMASKSEA